MRAKQQLRRFLDNALRTPEPPPSLAAAATHLCFVPKRSPQSLRKRDVFSIIFGAWKVTLCDESANLKTMGGQSMRVLSVGIEG